MPGESCVRLRANVSSPGLRRQKRVANRAGTGVVRGAPPGGERPRRVVESFGFDRVDGDSGEAVPQRQGRSRDQPAAAARHQRPVGQEAERRGLRRRFEPDRSLPGNDVGVVVRSHHRRAAFLGKRRADGFAALSPAVVETDLGAERARVVDLRARRVARHHDRGVGAEHCGGGGDSLRVVARRPRDDTARAFLRRQAADPVAGAAKLERAGALQRFRLDQQRPSGGGVERIRAQQRRHARDAAEPARGIDHVVDRRQSHRRGHGVANRTAGQAARSPRNRDHAYTLRTIANADTIVITVPGTKLL